MKIGIIADPHANYVALQAVVEHIETWNPDTVVIVGDVINRGPRPKQCLRLAMEKVDTKGWLLARGNHEDYVISQAKPDAPRIGPAFDVHRPSYWTYLQLGCDVSELEKMPSQQSIQDPSGSEIRFVHASMQGIRVGIYPENSDQAIREKMELDNPSSKPTPLAAICVGHTHRPLIRSLDDTLVVNAGSAGLPFDLDKRPAYAQLTWRNGSWQAKIIRIEYDHTQSMRDFRLSGYLEGSGPIARIVQIELQSARSLLYSWAKKYQEPASSGLISVEASVRKYLSDLGLQP